MPTGWDGLVGDNECYTAGDVGGKHKPTPRDTGGLMD